MARRAIDPVDTIWLHMDRANNLMVIESLMTLETPVDWDRFVAVLERRVAERYPVFTQRPVWPRLPGAMPYWEDDEDFDITGHLHHATLPDPGDDLALQNYVNRFVSTPLERDRPLWEMHLIDGHGAGSALYSRLHHSLADGVALTRVLLSMTDATPTGDLEEPPTPAAEHRGLLGSTAHALGVAGSAMLELPVVLDARHAQDVLTLARQTTGIVTKLLFTRNPGTPVAGVAGLTKRVVWAPPIPLAHIADAGHRTGTTVNDILMAALAGALSTYLCHHHGKPVDIPTMVPVNVRPADEPLPRELGNRFALVLLTLPSGESTPFARLAETKRRMDQIKQSPETLLTFGLLRGIGRTGPELERLLVDFFADKASGVTSNVTGPTEPRYLAGSRITGLLGWSPESGNQTLGTGICTYAGQVHVGFKVDTNTIPHPEELLAAFRAEVDALVALAGVP
jgi:WS/DGAT/MGAT family acyltransferase